MAQIIAIVNHKGGVGKTTTVVNVGAALALQGYSVLLVDFDPQANLSKTFRVSAPNNDFGALLKGRKISIVKTNNANISVVPANMGLTAAANQIKDSKKVAALLIAEKNNYDYILIDCPPNLGTLTAAALLSADKVFTVMLPEIYSLFGLKEMRQFIASAQKENKSLQFGGIIICRYSSRKLHRDVRADVTNCFPNIPIATIRENIALSEYVVSKTNIFDYSKKSNGAVDYNNLATIILNNQ